MPEERENQEKCGICYRPGLEFWETGNLYKRFAPKEPIVKKGCKKCEPMATICHQCNKRYPGNFTLGRDYLNPTYQFMYCGDRTFFDICFDCIRNSPEFFYCPKCKNWYEESDRDEEITTHCRHCIDSRYDIDCEINPYSTDVMKYLQFMGAPKDGIYYGVELELQNYTGDIGRSAHKINQLSKSFTLLKYDESVDPGFEIVSAPATLEVHTLMWKEIFHQLPPNMEATSSTGMHVHVSRDPLSQLTIGKILVFINHPDNRDEIVRIAGRQSNQYAYLMHKQISDARMKYDEYRSRYEAINIRNERTIEFRIFASTATYTTFMMRLEFVVAAVNFCQWTGNRQLQFADFTSWLSGQRKKYPHLAKFLHISSKAA